MLERVGAINPMNAEGWVLAGGQSLRMGCNKAGVLLGDERMLAHMLRKLRSLGLRARVGGLRESVADVAAEVVCDTHLDCGPLSGIETALAKSEADYVLLLGVDLPLVSTDFLAWMLARAERTEAIATVPRTAGEPQPLCAVYRREMLPVVTQALMDGNYKTMHAVERSSSLGRIDVFNTETLLASGAWNSALPVNLQFMNCNTPRDRALAEAVLFAYPML